jgi:pimeloyl-ACP methyl ester carboxylesterase
VREITMRLRFFGRLAVAGVAFVCILIVVAAGWQQLTTWRDRRDFPATGKLIPVGAGEIHLNCAGTGSPTVVISGGTGVLSLQWARIQREVAKNNRVCTWDRPGFAWSSQGSDPHTAGEAAEELYSALRGAREYGPYLLVGESYGGYVMRMFHNDHASAVAAIVFVESAHARQWDAIPEARALLLAVLPKLKAAVWLSRLGFLRWNISDYGQDLPQDVRPALIAFQAHTATMRAALAEIDGVFESARQVSNTRPIGSLPLVVVSAGRSFQKFLPNGDPAQLRQMNAKWMLLQIDLCHLSTNCVQLIQPEATHGIAREQPDFVVNAIHRALDMVPKVDR